MRGDAFQPGLDESAAGVIADYIVKLARNRMKSWREGTIPTIKDMTSMIESDARQNLGEFPNLMAIVASYTDSSAARLADQLWKICTALGPVGWAMIIVVIGGYVPSLINHDIGDAVIRYRRNVLTANCPASLRNTLTDKRIDEILSDIDFYKAIVVTLSDSLNQEELAILISLTSHFESESDGGETDRL